MFALAGASLYFIGGLSYGLNKMCYNFKNKYLKQLNIPESFYKNCSEKLKKDIVVSAKTKFIGLDKIDI